MNPPTVKMREVGGFFHPTIKPVGVMEWSIQRAGGDGVVLDPYLGSGSTAVAAIRLGRECVGIEIEERYCEAAAKRVEDAGRQGQLPLEGLC